MAVVGVLVGALTVLGCPGGDEGTPTGVATHDATIPVTSTTVQSLEDQTFTFESGSALSPALAEQPVALTFTNTAAATPTATVTAPNVPGTDGHPAHFTSNLTFGSCTFVVTVSTFDLPGPQVGDKITVNPCSFDVATGSIRTNHGTLVNILVRLGLIPSRAQQAEVSIDADGVVTVNGVDTGFAVLVVTGTEGG
jgi:hypothetical protein